MKLNELIAADAIMSSRDGAVEVTGLSADSRKIEPGFLFAALAGGTEDGARYIPEAIERGAAAVLIGTDVPLPAVGALAVIRASDPRHALAKMAARFFAPQPETAVAVTGTNGKTSVASFLNQLWTGLGHASASIGTLGVISHSSETRLALTTPDPVTLHRTLKSLAADHVTHVVLEASSHGLAQRRLDGVELKAAAFTNISRDHLDYHASFEDYFDQKIRLFRDLLPPGAGAVVYAGTSDAARIIAQAQARKLKIFTVGPEGSDLALLARERVPEGQLITVGFELEESRLVIPLAGDFQAANVLVAAGLAIVSGAAFADVAALIPALEGPRGRLEKAGVLANGAQVFIDYAHTPDALKNALETLRPYARGRLAVVFGCGGDRDRGKRPQMGAVAASYADLVFVTDDNPRFEDPAGIRAQIMAASPGAAEVPDRRDAINEAMSGLEPGDIVLVAGKGHETGQIKAGQVLPFSDHDVVASLLKEMN